MITVRWIWKPRHSPGSLAKAMPGVFTCWEYRGTLAYDAALRFHVALDKTDSDRARDSHDSGSPTLWLRQEISLRSRFLDLAKNECFDFTGSAVEYFSIGPWGVTADDYHRVGSPIYGDPCPLPCRQHGVATGALQIVVTKPFGGAEPQARRKPSGQYDDSVASGEWDGNHHKWTPTSPIHGYFYMVSDDVDRVAESVDVAATEEARKKYGGLSYGYQIEIDHCSDMSASMRTATPPGLRGSRYKDGSKMDPEKIEWQFIRKDPPEENTYSQDALVPGSDYQRSDRDGEMRRIMLVQDLPRSNESRARAGVRGQSGLPVALALTRFWRSRPPVAHRATRARENVFDSSQRRGPGVW